LNRKKEKRKKKRERVPYHPFYFNQSSKKKLELNFPNKTSRLCFIPDLASINIKRKEKKGKGKRKRKRKRNYLIFN